MDSLFLTCHIRTMHTFPSLNPCRPVALWLFACCILLLMMVGLGGYTRLSGSGLSITEWKPVTGIIPPLSDTEWTREIKKYQASPEYKEINRNVSIEAFKHIFRVEYFHRLLGRAIGICFLLPLLYFSYTRKLSISQALQLSCIFALGGLQGAAGWYMVKSGLIDNPHISPYRLTFHLLLALLIYSLLLWNALKYLSAEPLIEKVPPRLRRLATLLIILIALQITLGGMVAGLKAGYIYNTFPLMNGYLLPPDAGALQPFYMNFLQNPVMLQFLHRVNAMLVFICALILWAVSYTLPVRHKVRVTISVLVIMALAQFSLGIATLTGAVPIRLGVAHQLLAFLLASQSILILYLLKRCRFTERKMIPEIPPNLQQRQKRFSQQTPGCIRDLPLNQRHAEGKI